MSKAAHKGKLAVALCVLGVAFALAPAAASAGTITVNQLNDGYNDHNGVCSLREAITAAQGNGSFDSLSCDAGSDDNADTIVIPSGNTIPLTRTGIDNTNLNGDLDVIGTANGVDSALTITSSGPNPAGIDATGLGDRVLQTVTSSVSQEMTSFNIDNIDITGGATPGSGSGGGGLYLTGFTTASLNKVRVHNNSAGTFEFAGGMRADGPVTVTNSRFDHNSAPSAGGVSIGFIPSTIANSTIDDNHATDATNGFSGGLSVGGVAPNLTLKNSTVANNDAEAAGGGITVANGTLTMSNDTVAGNTADLDNTGGGDDGGGLYTLGTSSPTINSRNTIIGDNTDVSGGAPDCASTINSQGYNLIENATGCTFTNSNDLVGQDPKLNSLQGIGGQWIMPLLTGSPTFNGGNPATPTGTSPTCETTDQSGNTRPFAGAPAICDIGAVEVSASDADGDKQFTGLDNCPNDFNPGQENYDGDADGDVCDNDDDNDTVADGSDACAMGNTMWTSSGATDFDADGCRDAGEDLDDDNDNVPDATETGCPGGGIPTDTDSDNDGVLDQPDVFPCDPTESADTDGDGVGNNADNCDTQAGPASNGGCPVQPPPSGGSAGGSTTNPAASGPTGQRAAALKKCKKKHGAARAKCKKKANLLPV